MDLSLPIDRVENISRKEFQEKYMKPQIPVVIHHFYGTNAPVYNWTFDYFSRELGDLEVGIFDDESERRKDERSYKKASTKMKFAAYLDAIQAGPTSKRLFLFNVFKHKKDLLEDFTFPDVTDNVLKFLPFAFFGGQGAVTRMHRDMDNSCVFLTEVTGRKRVVLFDPKYSKLLYQYPFSTHTSVDINNPDYDKFPGLAQVQGMDFVLGPGDTLFMPSGWWHHIEYNTPGLGFAIRSLSPRFSDRLTGFLQVSLLTHIDEMMNKVLSTKWFDWKKKTADRRAHKALEDMLTS